MPLMAVTLEVSRLSGWLNADACCRVKRGACDAGRGAGRRACGALAAQAGTFTGEAQIKAWGQGARAERTQNMCFMSVTPEVSQLEMSALNFFNA